MTVNWKRVAWITVFFCLFCTGGAFAQESLLPTLQQLRAEYPERPSPAQVGELLTRAAASANGWGLLAKTSGTRCPGPRGTEISCDILLHNPSHTYRDVLRDADSVATPQWGPGEPCGLDADGNCAGFIAPDVVPPPPNPPVPAPIDLTPILTRLTALETALAAAQQQIALLRAGVDLLASRPYLTKCRASLFGIPLSCSLEAQP